MLKSHKFLEIQLFKFLWILQEDGYKYKLNSFEKGSLSSLKGYEGIKESQTYFSWELSEEQASNPLEVNIVKINTFRLDVLQKLWVYSVKDIFDVLERFLNSRPAICVVIQDLVHNFGKAPITVRLDVAEHFLVYVA